MAHKHVWKHYHGALGYESMKCEICGVDINDLKKKPTIDRFKTSIVKLHNENFAVYLEEHFLNGNESKPVAVFPTQQQAERFRTILSRKSVKQKEQIMRK